ncbi:MAG: hypothetical protein IJC71_02745 [Clostridia bacterium]|nr:hypothetical protein [Clostridia bacterium]
MKNKTYIILIASLFLLLALAAPVNRVLSALGIVSVTNIGNVIETEKTETDSALGKVLSAIDHGKSWLENLYTNYLPFYNETVMLAGEMEYALSDAVNALFAEKKQPAEESEPVSDTESETPETEEADPAKTIVSIRSRFLNDTGTHHNYLLTAEYGSGREVQALERVTAYSEEKLDELMETYLGQMLELVQFLSKYTHVVVYAGSRFQDFPVIEEAIEGAYSTEEDLNEFLDALSPYAVTGRLMLDTMETRLEKMYLTDHHWNHYGYQQGYEYILKLLGEEFPDIGEPLQGKKHLVKGLRFYGSFARLSNYYRIADNFSFYEYDLPAHTSGGARSFAEMKDLYLGGGYDNSKGVSHYDVFYQFYSQITFEENNTGRNLLLIGDSFSKAIAEPLASHFDTTILTGVGGSYNLPLMLKRHEITDVVILLYTDRMMYNLYNDMRLDLMIP